MNRAPGVCRVIKGHVAGCPEHSVPGLAGDQLLGRTGGDTVDVPRASSPAASQLDGHHQQMQAK